MAWRDGPANSVLPALPVSIRGAFVNSDDKPVAPQTPAHGPLRRLLKLMAEADSSRFAFSRLRAVLLLLALLAAFAALGYGLPTLLSHYFR